MEDQTYTTADYLPSEHLMNDAECTCAACSMAIEYELEETDGFYTSIEK